MQQHAMRGRVVHIKLAGLQHKVVKGACHLCWGDCLHVSHFVGVEVSSGNVIWYPPLSGHIPLGYLACGWARLTGAACCTHAWQLTGSAGHGGPDCNGLLQTSKL